MEFGSGALGSLIIDAIDARVRLLEAQRVSEGRPLGFSPVLNQAEDDLVKAQEALLKYCDELERSIALSLPAIRGDRP